MASPDRVNRKTRSPIFKNFLLTNSTYRLMFAAEKSSPKWCGSVCLSTWHYDTLSHLTCRAKTSLFSQWTIQVFYCGHLCTVHWWHRTDTWRARTRHNDVKPDKSHVCLCSIVFTEMCTNVNGKYINDTAVYNILYLFYYVQAVATNTYIVATAECDQLCV